MLMDRQSTPLAARRAPWPVLSRSSLNMAIIDTTTGLGLLALRESHTDFAQHVFFQIFSLFRIVKERYFAAYSLECALK
ncbi:hypothetical protein [Acerihabitans arboris]|uniref:Uncharacterized protein n=1 Tax=Acerihabitans arboris TaxID=2691583 RepID=A0A845SPU7_9GAMM|nr:hypothetical protein [Acerihabitans arboris]NDL66119.1 hypothetical protein [Acerihabitans arboris]